MGVRVSTTQREYYSHELTIGGLLQQIRAGEWGGSMGLACDGEFRD